MHAAAKKRNNRQYFTLFIQQSVSTGFIKMVAMVTFLC
jgi:hypothetical protein